MTKEKSVLTVNFKFKCLFGFSSTALTTLGVKKPRKRYRICVSLKKHKSTVKIDPCKLIFLKFNKIALKPD